jgi:hypothetical protein
MDGKTLAAKVLLIWISEIVYTKWQWSNNYRSRRSKTIRLADGCPDGSLLIGGGFSGPGDVTHSYLDDAGRVIVIVKGNPKET